MMTASKKLFTEFIYNFITCRQKSQAAEGFRQKKEYTHQNGQERRDPSQLIKKLSLPPPRPACPDLSVSASFVGCKRDSI